MSLDRLPLRSGAPALALGICMMLSACLTENSHKDYIGPFVGDEAATSPTAAIVPDAPPEPPLAATTGPLALSVVESVLLSLEHNRAFRVERFNPPLQRTFEQEARAAFDPVLGAQGGQARTRSQRLARFGTGVESQANEVTSVEGSITEFLPTGTTVGIDASGQRTESSLYTNTFTSLRGGVTITQALLRGFGLGVNLADLRQARLTTLMSRYELRGLAEALVAQVEETYWDTALAQRQIRIFEDSLRLAEQQLAETLERINVGELAESELAAAEAEVALRREALINARSALATTRLQLLTLLNAPGPQPLERELVLENEPTTGDVQLDPVDRHIELARLLRPELNQARLAIQRNELEIVQTRNGLLPRLDLFVTLGKTGYADRLRPAIDAWNEPGTYDTNYQAAFEYPLFNRRARALHRRAILTREQSVEALANLAQLVETDVRTAYIEVNRTNEQIAATAATRKFREQTLASEVEKFRVGRSTNLLVAQAQRDLVESQLAEVQAVVNYLKALINLYRLDGSLLERRGIAAPGREPLADAPKPTWRR